VTVLELYHYEPYANSVKNMVARYGQPLRGFRMTANYFARST
jgi:hypothetical protein